MGFSSYPVGSTPLRHRQLRRRVPARLTAPLLHKQDFFYNTYGLPTAWHRDNYTAGLVSLVGASRASPVPDEY